MVDYEVSGQGSEHTEALMAAVNALFDPENIEQKTIFKGRQLSAILACWTFGDLYDVEEFKLLARRTMLMLISEGGQSRKDLRHILASAMMGKSSDPESVRLRNKILG